MSVEVKEDILFFLELENKVSCLLGLKGLKMRNTRLQPHISLSC